VLASFAPTGDLLILARLIQGVGGAMMLLSTLSLLNATFRRERGIAFAVWGSTIGGMAGRRPPARRLADDSFSWLGWHQHPAPVIIAIGVLVAVASRAPRTLP
jgi:MFS family permease